MGKRRGGAPSAERHIHDSFALQISGYGPRPVAFASTTSKDGKGNLSPFSYTTFVNHDPPTMIIGFSPKIKDT